MNAQAQGLNHAETLEVDQDNYLDVTDRLSVMDAWLNSKSRFDWRRDAELIATEYRADDMVDMISSGLSLDMIMQRTEKKYEELCNTVLKAGVTTGVAV